MRIPLPGFDGIFAGTTVGATAGLVPPTSPCTAVTATMVDVWWFYFPPANGTLSIAREGTDASATNAADVAGVTALEFYDAAGGCSGWPSALICNATTTAVMTAPVIGGAAYLIRLGVAPGAAQGAFTLSINLLAAPTNDECVAPGAVFDGLNPTTGIYTNVAATNSAGATSACAAGAPGNSDVWFSYVASATGNSVASTCTPPGVSSPGSLADTILEAYPACGGVAIGCNDDDPACGTRSTVTFPTTAGATYLIRVSSKTTTTGTFYLTVNPAAPNDECSTAIPVAIGANGPYFHLGTTTSAGPQPGCAASNNDVWLAFTAPLTATLKADTCGSTVDTSLAVYASCGGAELACDNDDALNRGPCATSQTNAAYLEIPVIAGTTYYFRLGTVAATAFGASLLNLSYKFSLTVTIGAGFSSITLADVAGTPGATCLNVVTMSQGAYPNGWLYGVDIPYGELVSEILWGPPFLVVLDGAGGYVFSFPGAGTPLGLTFYCVGIELTANNTPARRSDLVTFNL